MNLLLIERGDLDDGVVRLTGRQALHLRSVVKVEAGSRLRVGLVRGPMGEGTVVAVSDAEITVEIELEAGSVAACPPVDLILAVPRPKALRRVLQNAAALGVGRVDLVNAWRVEKSYFQSPLLDPDAMRGELLLGCEQGSTTWLPDVEVHPLLMPFVDERMSATTEATRIVLHPRAAAPIETACPAGATKRVIAAIGPEGGWLDRELETFEAREFRAVALGDRVLRTETAVAALLAQLELLRRL